MRLSGHLPRVLFGLALSGLVIPGLVMPGLARADEGDVVIKALVDEMNRSMELQLGDLEKPYFIQYGVDDVVSHRLSASYGAMVGSDRDHSRRLSSQLRVGSYELDNTNFQGGGAGGFRGRLRGGGGGGGGALPIDDDYTALRQVIWRQTDRAYRSAVEELTEKRAYMEGRELEERPGDFTEVEAVEDVNPRLALEFDEATWQDRLRTISGRFESYPHILDSSVSLDAEVRNRYLVNSEGTRIRDGDAGATLTIRAEVQAEDGQRIDDELVYRAGSAEELPRVERILEDVAELAARLERAMTAPRLTEYNGPVLFDGLAAPQIFRELLVAGVAGQPDPVGMQRRRFRGSENLEKRLGRRILPDFLNVYDDPRAPSYRGQTLAGHYIYDDEGVPASRVDLVVEGKLEKMLMSRVPTDAFDTSNGHGRAGSATAGCLYVESTEALSPAELKQSLIDTARDMGLEYGIRISALGGGGGGGRALARGRGGRGGRGGPGGGGGGAAVSDPLRITKVYVEDGREEPVRGCEFVSFDVATLRDLVAAGRDATVLDTRVRGVGISVIAPALLVEELELLEIEAERESKPLLEPPHARKTEEGDGK